MSDEIAPLHVFRFGITFSDASFPGPGGDGAASEGDEIGFSECTGLEATMEPKVIKEGGRNYGAAQRAGQVSFGTVVLKRGMIRSLALWKWFTEATSQGRYARRRDVTITLRQQVQKEAGSVDEGGTVTVAAYEIKPVISWQLKRALPVKFKTADLSARATEVGIEELHLAHEGLRVGLDE